MLACRTRWTRHPPFAAVLLLHSLIGRLVSSIFIYIIWLISCRTDCHLHHTPLKKGTASKQSAQNQYYFSFHLRQISFLPRATQSSLWSVNKTQIARLTAPNTSPSSALPRSPPSPGTAAPNKIRRISTRIINSPPDQFQNKPR
ncbi:hypothetical protein V8C44DRAFT_90110 [Trichoderma aethiopicum]